MTDSIKRQFIPADLRQEVAGRLERIAEATRIAGADTLLVASNPNLFYCAARMFRGYVYIPAVGSPVYFIMRPDNFFEAADDMVFIRKPEQIPAELERMGYSLPATIGIEEDELYYSEVERLRKVFGDECRPVNSSPVLRGVRMIKTPYEIAEMEFDGVHQAEAYRHIPSLYTPDMTDLELQIETERTLRREGALGFSRMAGHLMEINMGNVINGRNADVPAPYEFAMGGAGVDPSLPGGADGAIMHPGTTVMIDMNGSFNGYQTDMTRVWRIGEIPELALKAHECSRSILRALEKATVPGIEICEMYKIAEEIVENEGLSQYFMGHNQQVKFIGHGVGIELNEQPPITPRNRTIVQERMTLAIEPKFVIPDVGAVGVENTYVVTPEGLRCITNFPEEIENLLD